MKNTIKIQRAIKNLTQAELAEKIQVSRQTINAIELGKYIPSTLLALRLAKVFEIQVEDIFQLEENEC
ncbi:MAG TPA: helix-turn-helix transcriptional regulator [Sphingobacteriaceae bacterium]|nr:helix-turn-helix transcriptional regulator [Sphingobacteriaceae bacterium]